MPRRPRLFLPDQPQHAVVRGHNRDPVLARHEDFQFLYQCLRDAAHRNGVAVHAWVLMHNHIHLLLTPATELSLPRTMQAVGRVLQPLLSPQRIAMGRALQVHPGRYRRLSARLLSVYRAQSGACRGCPAAGRLSVFQLCHERFGSRGSVGYAASGISGLGGRAGDGVAIA